MPGKYVVVDGCVAPARLAPVLEQIRKDTGCTYASIYRGDDATALLNSLGKHTQRQLWEATPSQRAAWGVLGTPNRPGQSTHELRSDGVAYPGPVGRHLAWWQCGIDVDDAHVAAFIADAAKHGWVAYRPYASGVEYHHVNFAKQPRLFAPNYHLGDQGPMVLLLTQRLVRLGYLDRRWWHFTPLVEQAVQRFQRDHHLVEDGVVGAGTWIAIKRLAGAVRGHKKHPPQKKPKPPPRPPATTITKAVVDAIAGFEGGQSPDGLFHPYRDPVGVWTIGFGHTAGVSASSRPLTKAQATALLEQDLNTIYVPAVLKAAKSYGWLPLTANQLGALVSFGFNLGNAYFTPLHTLGAALQHHNLKAAANAILLYDKAGSPPKPLPGLTKRRKWERDLFLKS